VDEHLPGVPQHERGVVADGRGHVPHLHPPFGLPAQELDLVGLEMRAPRDRGGPVVFLDPLVDDQPAIDEVARHRRARVRRRMLDVRPVDVLTREGEVGPDRLGRVVRVADNQSADDEHPVPVQHLDRRHGRVSRPPSVLARPVLRVRLQEREVVVEDVLDPEEDVAEAGLPHQRREHLAVRRDGRRHPLHHVVDVGEAGVDDGFAQQLEALHVERDVVVDDEDGARAPAAGVGDVGDDAWNREAVEVPPAHLDDRAEAAVERAAARRLDDVHLAAEHRVAGEHARIPLRRRDRAVLDGDDGPGWRLDEDVALAKPQAGDRRQRTLSIQRAQQLAKRQLALAADDRVHAEGRMRPRLGREARVVPADDDERLGPHRADEPDQPPRGRTLKRHD